MYRILLQLMLFTSAVVLSGCSSIAPEIANPPTDDIALTTVRSTPDQFVDTAVRWGGVIAAVENRPEETLLEIVARELDRNGRPRNVDQSAGRFIAVVPDFLDPAIYNEGRAITVFGLLGRSIERAIGGYPYTYPRVHVSQLRLWQPLPQYSPYSYPYPYWGYDPMYGPWYGPAYDPWYGPWRPYPWQYPRLIYR